MNNLQTNHGVLAPERFESVAGGREEVSFGSLLSILWRRRWGSMLIVAACLAAAVIYLRRATPLYHVMSVIRIDRSVHRVVLTPEDIASGGNDRSGDLYVQIKSIKSPAVLGAVTGNGEFLGLRLMQGMNERQAMGFLRGALKTDLDPRDDSVAIGLDSPYPEDAARVVNAVVESYVRSRLREAHSSGEDLIATLQKEKSLWETERLAKLKELAEFRRVHRGEVSGSAVTEAFKVLSSELTGAQWESSQAKALLDSAKEAGDDPRKLARLLAVHHGQGIEMPRAGELADARRGLRAALDEIASGEISYGKQSKLLDPLRQRADSLSAQLSQLEAQSASELLEILEARWGEAVRKEQSLKARLGEQQQRMTRLDSEGNPQLAIMESDLRRTERLLDLIDSRMKQVQVNQRSSEAGVTVLESAEASHSPISPRRNTVLALASGIGLVLGIGYALILDWQDPRYRSIKEIRSSFQAPMLGVVPHVRRAGGLRELGQMVGNRPRSEFAESFRAMRTAVLFGASRDSVRTLLVTSPAESDGKTIVSSNLAIALAQGGRRVLLIDADFHRPRQHVLFCVTGNRGLSDVLQGQIELAQAVRATSIEGLHLLPSGPLPLDPAEMLGSSAFRGVIGQLQALYDMVVIDSAPALMVADPSVLGAQCDATLLVLRAGRSTRQAGEKAAENLLRVGSRVLGIVANDVRTQDSSYRYGSYVKRELIEGEQIKSLSGNSHTPGA